MMDKEWISIFGNLISVAGALTGVALGSIATYFINGKNLRVQLKYQAEKEHKLFRREKIENLYNILTKFQKGTLLFISQIYAVNIEKEQAKRAIEIFANYLEPTATIDLLICLYFHDLKDELDELDIHLRGLRHFVVHPSKQIDSAALSKQAEQVTLICTKMLEKLEALSKNDKN